MYSQYIILLNYSIITIQYLEYNKALLTPMGSTGKRHQTFIDYGRLSE